MTTAFNKGNNLTEFLIAYKQELLSIGGFITLPFLVFIVCLAHVYLWGRMLNIVQGYRARNTLATITMAVIYSFFFLFFREQGESIFNAIWKIFVYSSLSIIFYVNIGFKFYDRWEAVLDRWAKLDNREVKKKEIKKKK